MKTIGLIGGMSWQSTVLYYQQINEGIAAALGDLHSAKICLISVNFAEIEELQHSGNWQQAAVILCEAAIKLEQAGANYILICTNTMHKVYPEIQRQVDVPILHIADATANRLVDDGILKVGLLGTAFTMEQGFYKDTLTDDFGLEVIIPDRNDRKIVHDIIYSELCNGMVSDHSRNAYIEIMEKMKQQGAQAIILGCTEITLLVKQQYFDLPLYDTTAIHAQEAVAKAISREVH